MDLKCVMDELKSLKNEIKTISDTLMDSTNKLNDKIDRQTEKFVNWMHFLENKTTLRLVRIDETVRKSANSINVIVRLVAVSTSIKLTDNFVTLPIIYHLIIRRLIQIKLIT